MGTPLSTPTDIVCSNIMAHLDEHKLSSDRQRAFRKEHSCDWTKIDRSIHSYWILRRHLIHPLMNSIEANRAAEMDRFFSML